MIELFDKNSMTEVLSHPKERLNINYGDAINNISSNIGQTSNF